jgi:hypothetical protein
LNEAIVADMLPVALIVHVLLTAVAIVWISYALPTPMQQAVTQLAVSVTVNGELGLPVQVEARSPAPEITSAPSSAGVIDPDANVVPEVVVPLFW